MRWSLGTTAYQAIGTTAYQARVGNNNRLENMGSPLEVPRVEQHYSSVSYALGLFIKRVSGERGVVSEDNCVFHLYNLILRWERVGVVLFVVEVLGEGAVCFKCGVIG